MLGARHCLLYTKLIISLYIYVYKSFLKILLLVSLAHFPSEENPEHRGSGDFCCMVTILYNKRLLCYLILSFKPLFFGVFPFLLVACISSTNILLPSHFNSKSSKGETAKIISLSGSLQEPHRN